MVFRIVVEREVKRRRAITIVSVEDNNSFQFELRRKSKTCSVNEFINSQIIVVIMTKEERSLDYVTTMYQSYRHGSSVLHIILVRVVDFLILPLSVQFLIYAMTI